MANPFDDDGKSILTDVNFLPFSEPVKSYTKKNKSDEDYALDYERDLERLMQESLSSTQRSAQHCRP